MSLRAACCPAWWVRMCWWRLPWAVLLGDLSFTDGNELLHPDICKQYEAAPHRTAWFPNILVRKDHVRWAEWRFPVCSQVSPLVLITSWKPTAYLWCMIRGDTRFAQLSSFSPKALQSCLNSYFSSGELVGGLCYVVMERPKEKKQSNGWLTRKWMNLASVRGIWSHSGVSLCKYQSSYPRSHPLFAVLTLYSHHLCPGWDYPQSWCSYRYWELTSVRSDCVQLGVTLKYR